MRGCGGCLTFLYWGYFGWVHVVATLGARSAGRRSAIPGPESEDLLPHVRGVILLRQPGGGILQIALPTREETMVRRPAPDNASLAPAVHALSGPDGHGRIALMEDRLGLQLRLRVLDRSDSPGRILFNRASTGDEWARGTAAGKDLALSPAGGKIAFLSHLTGVQMQDPPALLQTGRLELWNADGSGGEAVGVTALDAGLSWFPGGRHLAYTALAAREAMEPLPLEPDGFGSGNEAWPQIPVTCILDTESDETQRLHPGWQPMVSTDSQAILVSDFNYRWRLVNVATRESSPVQAPGQWGWPVALIDSRWVLYPGYPTAGTPIRVTKYNSPLSGPKLMMTLKLADLQTGEFQTVVPYFDTRDPVSFGFSAS